MTRHPFSALFVLVIAAYYTCSTGVLANCNSWFGPAGYINCVKLDGYYGYQWATCRTDTYIQTKSNNRHQCSNRFTTYCYYQCMIDVHDQEDGFVFSDCKCSPDDPVPTASVPLPSWCYSPDGKNCSWYGKCLSKAYPQCENDDNDYGIKFAEKFCKLYNESSSKLSPQGQRWIDAVRKCLQLKLVPLVDKTRDKSCVDLKITAFYSHSPCYLNPDETSLSYCDLPLGDRLGVFWTIKSSFFHAFVPSLKGLLEGMIGCTRTAIQSYVYNTKVKIKKAVRAITDQAKKTEETKTRIKTWLEDTVSPIPIQLDLLIESDNLPKFFNRRKRSLEDDKEIARSKYAGKVLDDVALQENWQDKGVAWFGYANKGIKREENTMSIRLLVADRNKYNSLKTDPRFKYDAVDNTSLSKTKPVGLITTLVELSVAVMNGTHNLMVDGERVTIIQLNGLDCKEHAFSVEGNEAVTYGAMYTLSLTYFVINILFVS